MEFEQSDKADVEALWLLVTASIVFFMQTGFICLEVGSVRKESTSHVLMKNVLITAAGGCAWLFIGYDIAYHRIGTLFANSMSGLEGAFWFQQWAFAAVSTTIVSGAVMERCSVVAYILYSVLVTGVVYPVVVNWTWGKGWLTTALTHAFIDHAGSGVVHMTGGLTGLVGAYFLGARFKRFKSVEVEEAESNLSLSLGARCWRVCCCRQPLPSPSPASASASASASHPQPHRLVRKWVIDVQYPAQSEALIAAGSLMLWFCWYSFNCGSAGKVFEDGMVDAVSAGVATTLSACGGALSAALASHRMEGFISYSHTLNGMLAGLVSITAGCPYISPYNALIVGIVAGMLLVVASHQVKKFAIDDPVDAVAVHCVGGMWGIIAVGLFSRRYGLFIKGTANLLGVQIVGLLAILAWSGACAVMLFGTLQLTRDKFGIDFLRRDFSQETRGFAPAKEEEQERLKQFFLSTFLDASTPRQQQHSAGDLEMGELKLQSHQSATKGVGMSESVLEAATLVLVLVLEGVRQGASANNDPPANVELESGFRWRNGRFFETEARGGTACSRSREAPRRAKASVRWTRSPAAHKQRAVVHLALQEASSQPADKPEELLN